MRTPNRGPAESLVMKPLEIIGLEAAAAHLLYLPPYSPDFNRIEMAFSKFKALMRAAEPRIVEELWKAATKEIEKNHP